MKVEPRIRAIIFDVDGTLLDTYEFVMRNFEGALASQGVVKSREEIDVLLGKTIRETYPHLVPENVVEAVIAKHRELADLPELRNLITVFDHAQQLLETLRSRAIMCAALSNRLQPSLDTLLEETGLRNAFSIVFGANDVPRAKPDPVGIQMICEQLCVSPMTTIMIGDTPIDIETAKNARLRAAVGVTHGFGTREQLEAAQADYVVDSLEELAILIERLNDGED